MKKSLLIIGLLTTLALSSAQSLVDVLPDGTFFAIGTANLSDHKDKLETFRAEFERLGVADALSALMDSEVNAQTDDLNLEEIDVFGAVEKEAWLAVSADPFNPLPAVSAVMTMNADMSAWAAEKIAEAAADENTQALTEGGVTFYVSEVQVEDEDPELQGMSQIIAFGQAGDTFMVSSNPDVLRGLIRRYNGADEPALSSTDVYANTLGQLPAGNFYQFVNFSEIANIISSTPLTQGLGFDALIGRVLQAFNTAGTVASVSIITDGGLESQGLQLANPEGGDTSLLSLLTDPTAADTSLLNFAPAQALDANVSAINIGAWWNYLNEIAASSPELGSDLNTLGMMFLGVDLSTDLFSWMGNQLVTVTTGLSEAVEPGVPSENMLGELVFVIPATDSAAAETGLSNLMMTLSQMLASFTSPTGEGEGMAEQTMDVAGVTVHKYDISSGVSISYALVGNNVVIATSDTAMASVLEAQSAQNSVLNAEAYSALIAGVPAEATTLGLSNNRATIEGSASQLKSSLQIAAGMGGAANLDFDAVTSAADTVEAFLLFIAERAGNGVSYSLVNENTITSYGTVQINW